MDSGISLSRFHSLCALANGRCRATLSTKRKTQLKGNLENGSMFGPSETTPMHGKEQNTQISKLFLFWRGGLKDKMGRAWHLGYFKQGLPRTGGSRGHRWLNSFSMRQSPPFSSSQRVWALGGKTIPTGLSKRLECETGRCLSLSDSQFSWLLLCVFHVHERRGGGQSVY